jgi:hypothetical protein
VRKNRRRRSNVVVVVVVVFIVVVISYFSCQFSLYATKEKKRKNDSIDRWMHGKMHGRKGDLHPPPQHTQSQKKEKKREKSKTLAKTINNNS